MSSMSNQTPDYRGLPEVFLDKMRVLLGEEYGAYLDSFSEEPCYGLRVNTLKIDPAAFSAMAGTVTPGTAASDAAPAVRRPRENGFGLSPIPWIPNGFYYDREARPARHPWYFAGLYYLQEPSAMTPASLLPIEPGDKVLDLCAAPGGKSTELAARLRGEGLLFANDISNSRAKALLKNLELAGAGNICVSSEQPEKLARRLEGFFDKILVDAPCSGEGMFRRDSDMLKSYGQKGPDFYVPLQRAILSEAVKMLAPGGMLLYSTCTFDRGEDEGAVRFLLEQFPEMRLLNLEKKEGFEPGAGLPECVRLFPHRLKGEGHFIALLQKKGRAYSRGTETAGNKKKPAGAEEPVLEFLSHIRRPFESDRIFCSGAQVYYLPKPFAEAGNSLLKGIRYLRTGLLLGEVKKGRFEPSQALAMWLNTEEYGTRLELCSGDGRVIRYLKGETLTLTPEEVSRTDGEKGWCLVCVDGYPLGWGRFQNQSLKNKYYSGWRWQ